jgi:preprotein translocase subunit SecB
VRLARAVERVKDSSPPIAEVALELFVTPDPRFQPYVIHVVITGAFQRLASTTEEQFDQFCNRGALGLLFPYARTLIGSITSDGRFGPVRLDPLNVMGLIAKAEAEATAAAAKGKGEQAAAKK